MGVYDAWSCSKTCRERMAIAHPCKAHRHKEQSSAQERTCLSVLHREDLTLVMEGLDSFCVRFRRMRLFQRVSPIKEQLTP